MLAEDVLLLLTDDATGKSLVDSTRLDLALAGALLVDLIEQGRVDISEAGKGIKPGRVVVSDPTPTGDPLLDDALRRIAAARPVKPEYLLSRLGKGVRSELLARLAQRGVLRAEEGRILGIFPTRSWPAADSSHEEAVRHGLYEVLVSNRSPAPEEIALISLLSAVDRTPKVLADSGLDKAELKRRAKAVTEGEVAGEAVNKAVAAISAAVVVGIAAAVSSSG